MKRLLYFLLTISVFAHAYADTTEQGTVKEYRGADDKTALPGVELMIKGAPSTISDAQGNFTLRFATLGPGEKVDYTEIYKDGFVIFNKDALDAWRISNNGRPFTIVMCREADFRALKKKFYGIIEKSYRSEYEREKARALKLAQDEAELNEKLRAAEQSFNEKMGNINTYVELFSRIDRNEMDSIEARALTFLEAGNIKAAIDTYEELQLSRQMESQMGKWDAAIEMRRAAEGMESQAQADLTLLVDKLQKQLGLYEMGGDEYNEKRLKLIDDIIRLMYRLNPVTNGLYSENIGRLLLMRSKSKEWNDREADLREAASIPSAVGLWALADRYEILNGTSRQYTDTIRSLYRQALSLNLADSIRERLEIRSYFLPDGFHQGNDGNTYPFKILSDGSAMLTGNSYYFSAPMAGAASAPEEIFYEGSTHPVRYVYGSTFSNNPELRKVILPPGIIQITNGTFNKCQSLDTIIAGPDISIFPNDLSLNTFVILPDGTEETDWILDRLKSYSENIHDRSEYAGQRNELLKPLIAYAQKYKEKEWGENIGIELALNYLAMGDTVAALDLSRQLVKSFSPYGHSLAGIVYRAIGEKELEIKSFEKAMKVSPLVAGNMLAYIYALPEYGICDQKTALEYIDKALSQCPADHAFRSNLLDSKGEIYLLFDDESSAKQLYDQVCLEYPDLYSETESKLHAHFASVQQPTTDENEQKPTTKSKDKTNIQNYIDIVQAVARMEYKKFDIPNLLPSPEYEEYLAIGIIAVQAMIKNKTPEELEKYNTAYIGTAVRWAIRNEMELRYDWYNITPMARFDYSFEKNKKLIEEKGFDARQLRVVISIYTLIRDLYYYLPAESGVKPEVDEMWSLIAANKKLLSEEQSAFLDYLTLPEEEYVDIFDTFDITLITSTIAMVSQSLKSEGKRGYTVVRGQKTEDLESGKFEEDQKKKQQLTPKLLDIAKTAAGVVAASLNGQKIDADLDELISIAAVAAKVLIQQNTAELLEKYSDIYLYMAFVMAIQNELASRDPEKYHFFRKSNEYTLLEAKITMVDNLKNLYYLCQASGDNSDLSAFVGERWALISAKISEMTPASKEIGIDVSRQESSAAYILSRYNEDALAQFIKELDDSIILPKNRAAND